jgi:hypothetical protein
VGTFAATNVTTYLGGYDLTGDLNSTTVELGVDPQVCTPWGSVAVKRVAGLRDVSSKSDGYWQSDTAAVDPTVFDGLTDLQVVTHTPTGTVVDIAYFYQARTFSYEMFGQVGEVVPFSLSAQGVRGNGTLSVGAIRGRVLKAKSAVSATGATGTAYQLGATSASQYLYGAVHLMGTAGTSITLVLESDADNTFASATTRITFGSLTALGGTWGTRVAGAITDEWYRIRVTECTGTWTVAAVAGIR